MTKNSRTERLAESLRHGEAELKQLKSGGAWKGMGSDAVACCAMAALTALGFSLGLAWREHR
jgi:hypothetical protein